MPLPSVFVTGGTRASSAGATSRAPALPGSRVNGNLLIAIVGSKNNETHSWSEGWNKADQVNSGTGLTVSWGWRWVDGTEAAPTVSWTSSVACFGKVVQLAHWGAGGRNPIGATRSNNGTTSTHSCNEITTTADASTVIYLDGAAANTALGTPANFAEWWDAGSATGATRDAGGGRTINASGSGSSNISVTGANAAWVMWQIEILAYLPSSGLGIPGGDTSELPAPQGGGIAPNIPAGLGSERGRPGPALRAIQRFSDRTLRNRPGLHLAAAQEGQYSYTGSGGLTLAGAATLEKAKVFTASGGLTLAGSAALAKIKAFEASGGLTFGGSAVTAKVTIREYVGSGGLTLAGAAELAKTKAATGAGGLTLAGTAETAKSRSCTGSGGLQLAGAGELAKTKAFAGSGGLAFAGAATTSYTAGGSAWEYTGSGGIQYAGAAELVKVKAATASGGLTLAGAGAVAKIKDYTPSGGVTLAGAAALSKTKAYEGAGGLTFAGAAVTAEANEWRYTASGGLTLAGAAGLAKTKAATGAGVLTLAGGASWSREWVYAASGAIAFAGAGATARVKVFTPSGGITLAGAAVTSIATAGAWEYTGSGGLQLAGAALLAKTRGWIASGGVQLGGAAATSFSASFAYTGTGGYTFGGAALTAKLAEYSYAGTGGLVLAGAADLTKVKAVEGAGGLALGGAAVTSYTPGVLVYQYTGSGQLTFGGFALTDGPRLEPEVVQAPTTGGQPSTTTRFRRGPGVSKDTLDLIGDIARESKRTKRITAAGTESAIADAASKLERQLAAKVAKKQLTPERAREISQHNALVLSLAIMADQADD